METSTEKKRAGRPELPLDQRRTGRLAMRTYPDVEEKAKRVGTAAVEAAIRNIQEMQNQEMDESSTGDVMKFTDADQLLFQTIYNSKSFNFPCPAEIVKAAKRFIDSGLVLIVRQDIRTGAADLTVTDKGLMQLLVAGRKLQTLIKM